MKIYIDSAVIAEIMKYMSWGICDGVTTNPTIMHNCGVTNQELMTIRQKEIAELIAPLPLSLEVTTDDMEQALIQGRELAGIAPNIMVKVTVTDRNGNPMLPVIHQLASEGVALNITAMTTQNQAILTAIALENGKKAGLKAGKNAPFNHVVSIFGGRISEEHGVRVATEIIRNVRDWLDLHGNSTEIIVGSVRSPENVTEWSMSGAHILTIPPDTLAKSMRSGRTCETVTQFLADAQKSLNEM